MSLYSVDGNTQLMISKIMEMANQSYMWRQNSQNSESLNLEIKTVKTEYDELKSKLTNEEIKFLDSYHKIKDLINKGSQFGIKINPKQMKKYNKELFSMENNNKEIISKYSKIYIPFSVVKDKYHKLVDDKEYYQGILKYQIESIIEFLIENGYITSDYKLTTLGVIAKEINECNEIVFSQAVNNAYFNDLSVPEIVGLISVFVEDGGATNEDVYISNLSLPDYLENILYEIGSIAESFADKENKFIQEKDIYLTNDWNLHLSVFRSAYEWASNRSFNDIKMIYNSFEGNFIKNILRINNIIRDLMVAAEITKNHQLYNKLENIESILIRDEVTVESLYVN